MPELEPKQSSTNITNWVEWLISRGEAELLFESQDETGYRKIYKVDEDPLVYISGRGIALDTWLTSDKVNKKWQNALDARSLARRTVQY